MYTLSYLDFLGVKAILIDWIFASV